MKTAVLGGGHGAYAAAADLAAAGHEVVLWRRDAAALDALRADPRIVRKDSAVRSVAIAGASADLGAAIAGAELIVVPLLATAQGDVARACAASRRRPGRLPAAGKLRQLRDGAARARGLGLRFAALGVVEFIDVGGADLLHHASREMAAAVDAARDAAPAIVAAHIAANRLGQKTGSGFYDYAGRDRAAYRRDLPGRTLAMVRHAGLWRPSAEDALP
ncbi:MAG TPA: 3-hydroxyacyl-CoA dehydrogenase family protein [Caldimonas sp.]|jgi:3-hydroxyacyl-CoA dehydrogenase